MTGPLTCIVVDYEAPIAARIARLAEAEGLRVLDVCCSGEEALDAIAELDPAIAFLDVRMPGLSGLGVLERLADCPDPPACVLVTAFNEHAVAAFALAAVDYVLKPVARDRFAAAVDRARITVEARDAAAQLVRLRGALSADRPERITLRDGARLVQLDPRSIVRVEAAGDYVTLHADGRQHLLPIGLSALTTLLPSPPFQRCHRSHVINLDHVRSCGSNGDGRLMIEIEGTHVPVSRSHTDAVRQVLSQSPSTRTEGSSA